MNPYIVFQLTVDGVLGVVTPVARKYVELDLKHETDIVTILLLQEVEYHVLEIHRKQQIVTLTDALVCILHLINQQKGSKNNFYAKNKQTNCEMKFQIVTVTQYLEVVEYRELHQEDINVDVLTILFPVQAATGSATVFMITDAMVAKN